MNAFADLIEAQCIREAVRAQSAGKQADLTHAVASALALTIALQAKGHPKACDLVLRVILEELPTMVEKRAAAVRDHLMEISQ
ncbi:hypothetical protein A3862_27280 [Methylobacterium sp. XJLW]|jgi:molybdopterin biosynthesis enzyme MoaB|uniref:hypothetical protein n=1 Tax=Methylobacterium sp. XJLW TaxID=739141 RepID=UPI000DAB0F81|nr:hypothetical protein [Methylobacterium sp. XJLW]AWV18784.1 hypothetical protein A3862_27280 [Methylobacterium sp. XJLW]